VVVQGGDYFGRTVNVAARISDYAQPGAVLVSDAIVAAGEGLPAVRYAPIGPVTLKGLTAPVSLYAASRAD
jgi:adenylate cyclase